MLTAYIVRDGRISSNWTFTRRAVARDFVKAYLKRRVVCDTVRLAERIQLRVRAGSF